MGLSGRRSGEMSDGPFWRNVPNMSVVGRGKCWVIMTNPGKSLKIN